MLHRWAPLRNSIALQWRHNGRDGFSNHQPHDCLLNRLFKAQISEILKLRDTGLCARSSPGTGEFPAQMASNAVNVSIWWRHHVYMRDAQHELLPSFDSFEYVLLSNIAPQEIRVITLANVDQDMCCCMASLRDKWQWLNTDWKVQNDSDIWSCLSALNASSIEIPAAPLKAGNKGNQAIWWLTINRPGSCYRWEGCLSHP